jgi:hypothetical protein
VYKLVRTNYALRPVIVKVLKAAMPSLKELAKEAGITYRQARSYQAGQRTPPPAVVAGLVKALRARSGRLAKLANELERAAHQPTKGRKP